MRFPNPTNQPESLSAMHPPWEMTIDRQRSSTFLMYMILHDVGEDYWSISFFVIVSTFFHVNEDYWSMYTWHKKFPRNPQDLWWPACSDFASALATAWPPPRCHFQAYKLKRGLAASDRWRQLPAPWRYRAGCGGSGRCTPPCAPPARFAAAPAPAQPAVAAEAAAAQRQVLSRCRRRRRTLTTWLSALVVGVWPLHAAQRTCMGRVSPSSSRARSVALASTSAACPRR
jgi:hypothetical protein